MSSTPLCGPSHARPLPAQALPAISHSPALPCTPPLPRHAASPRGSPAVPAVDDDAQHIFGRPGVDTQGPSGSRVPDLDRRPRRAPVWGGDGGADEPAWRYAGDPEAPPDAVGARWRCPPVVCVASAGLLPRVVGCCRLGRRKARASAGATPAAAGCSPPRRRPTMARPPPAGPRAPLDADMTEAVLEGGDPAGGLEQELPPTVCTC